MGRPDIDANASDRMPPPFPAFFTRKYKRMEAVLIENGQFEATAKRRACYQIPHPINVDGKRVPDLDLNQIFRVGYPECHCRLFRPSVYPA
jgi:hypothetical protein